MKTEYAPDNTRSSIMIVLGLAAVMTLIAVLVGLSEKPQVAFVGVAAGSGNQPAAAAPAANFGFDPDGTTGGADDGAGDGADAVANGAGDNAASDDELGEPFDEALPDSQRALPDTIIVVPTVEPTATPEVAAAVAPTAVPDAETEAGALAADALGTAVLPTTTGTTQGAFFTKSDEAEGARVDQNLITISYAPDGTGSFQGVLDITYPDGTHILMNMSGPITWTTANPQVDATLTGAFTLDAPIAIDSTASNDAELTISSLATGSGSLCTPQCFGFTFTSPL